MWYMIGGKETYPNTAYFSTEVTFLSWFQNSFLRNVTEYPCLLIYDWPVSHVGIELVESVMENNGVILKLPSHTSHVLQPLDLAFFRDCLKSK